MAAWGTGLYQDDVAEDVKEDYYNCFREDGLDNKAAYDWRKASLPEMGIKKHLSIKWRKI